MPKKLTKQQVEDKINKYGFFFLPNTNYTNSKSDMELYDAQLGENVKLSLNKINYRINRNYRSEYDVFNILNDVSQQQHQQQSGFDRFCNKLRSYNLFDTLSDTKKQQAYNFFQQLCGNLSRKKTFDIDFANNDLDNNLLLFIITEALQTLKKKMDKRVQIKISYGDDTYHYYTLSYDTINYFEALLRDDTPQEVTDSVSDMFDTHLDWTSIKIEFKDNVNAGGFFPYTNKLTSLNLSQFGIYNEIDYNNYKNNCLIEALANSGKFNEEQINLIKSSVYMRIISIDYIQKICDLMKCNISIRIPEENTNKTSAKIYKAKTPSTNNIVIFLYYDHFMINNELYVSEYYIANHETIDNKYPNDISRFEIINDNGDKRHQKITIVRLIKLLRQYNLLEPIPEEEQQTIAKQYNHFEYKPAELIDDYFRPITIKDKSDKQQDLLNKLYQNDGYFMFGEHILNSKKLNKLYDDLQEVVNSLNVNVRVRNYNKFAELMNKIMYEYGCFNNVYDNKRSIGVSKTTYNRR